MLDAVTAAVRAKVGPTVLNAGVGTGALSRRLARAVPGVHPVLVDLSPGMLAGAVDLAGPRAVASVAALPFPDSTFDVVMSAWVIETVDDPAAAVTEMLGVLRPGGLLAYSFCSRPARRWDRWRTGPNQGRRPRAVRRSLPPRGADAVPRLHDIAAELFRVRRGERGAAQRKCCTVAVSDGSTA
ncbi:MAG: ubiquinone biosynthesis protein UbiE [Frankiales bacterium]|nr:ubiquinone biosynthesis protein UbiE [Frankiales bacterium]